MGVGDWDEYIRRRRDGYDNPRKLHYLDSTCGIIVYQEQYLLLANTYAGWDIAYSDKHIRKNHNIKADTELKAKFITDSFANGYPIEETEKIWEEIVEVVSGGYGFNRSHAASYAKLMYQTAYLKTYYPIEFYASLMTIEGNDSNELSKIKLVLDRLQIKLLPPDINESDLKFVPTKEGIKYRLNSVNGVGGSTLYEINKLKPITSLEDFIERRTPKFVKLNVIASLIKAGCFDFDNPNRYEQLQVLEELTTYSDAVERKNYVYEKESLGLYLSDAPYNKYATTDFKEFVNGRLVSTIGEVIDVSQIFDKNGNSMAFASIINKHGIVKLVIFTKLWNQKGVQDIFTIGNMVMVNGKKDGVSMLVNTVERLEE